MNDFIIDLRALVWLLDIREEEIKQMNGCLARNDQAEAKKHKDIAESILKGIKLSAARSLAQAGIRDKEVKK